MGWLEKLFAPAENMQVLEKVEVTHKGEKLSKDYIWNKTGDKWKRTFVLVRPNGGLPIGSIALRQSKYRVLLLCGKTHKAQVKFTVPEEKDFLYGTDNVIAYSHGTPSRSPQVIAWEK